MTEHPSIVAVGAAAIDEWYAVSNLPEPDGGAFASEVTSTNRFTQPGLPTRETVEAFLDERGSAEY